MGFLDSVKLKFKTRLTILCQQAKFNEKDGKTCIITVTLHSAINYNPMFYPTRFYEELTLRLYEENEMRKKKTDKNHLPQQEITLSLEQVTVVVF